jgi:CheY-like chemotaxis protein
MTLDEPELLSARILVVDDLPANVALLCQMLAGEGYTAVTGITNPRDVAPLHAREPYDLILLDLQMPGMDGFEVMAALKEHEPLGYLPVLVVTAQPAHKLRALQAGARDFVSKPFDVLEIKTRIRNMLEVRLLHKRIEGDNRLLEQAVALRTAELRESEARFRALVELASDWYWEQDEHGVFTKVAGPALEMLGLGEGADAGTADGSDATPLRGDAAARPHWNADDRAQLEEKLAMRRPFLDFVYRRVNADGSEQFLQASGEPKFDETGRFTGYRGIGMDVTGRMHTAAAAPGLARFRQALDAGADAVLLVDRATMRYVDANTAACALSGYSRDELLVRGPADLGSDGGMSPRSAEAFDALIADATGARATSGAGGADGADRAIGAVGADGSCETLRRNDGAMVQVVVRRHAAQTDEGWTLVEILREAPRLPADH